MTEELDHDTTFEPVAPAPEAEPVAPEPAAPDTEPEPAAPEVTYAPTVVNSQAHEKIQAGERANVGRTVDVSQR